MIANITNNGQHLWNLIPQMNQQTVQAKYPQDLQIQKHGFGCWLLSANDTGSPNTDRFDIQI